MTAVTQGNAGPITARERIVTLDVLRGFALLGILVVNISFFANPISDPFNFNMHSSADAVAGWLIGFFAQGKFYPLFSLLFGLGFAVQLERAQARRRSFVPVYLRRLLVLLAIGVAHGVLVWAGDILTVYALLGFLLLLAGRGSARWLLILAGIAYAVQILLVIGMSWSMQLAAECRPGAADVLSDRCASSGVSEMIAGFEQAQSEADRMRIAARQAYTQGSFAEVTAVRVDEFGMMLSNMGFFGAQVLAMFLLGAWIGRRGILASPDEHRDFFKRLLWLALLVGVPLSAWFASVNLRVDYTDMYDPGVATAFMINLFAGPLLALGYVAAIALAIQNHSFRWLMTLAPVGRMALSNYLLQSLICTVLFYSYGLGLMAADLGMLTQLGIVLAVFVAQLLFSRWYMARFAFGPMEWFWRAATYLRKP